MTVQELFQEGHLDEAIKALANQVRESPTDPKPRTFLFELLCFAGDWSRAEKQLDVLSQGGPGSEMGALFYRGALAAERTRQELFEKKSYPTAFSAVKVNGSANGRTFRSLIDADPRIGANLELFVAGSYMWVPFSVLSSIHIQPPKRLRDLLWLPAIVRPSAAFQGHEFGDVLLPVLSPFSWQSDDPAVKLGRITIWENEAGEIIPKGQKLFVSDDEEWPLLDLRDLEFEQADC